MLRRLALATLAACGFALALPTPSSAVLHAGDPAPNFRGTDLNGVSHTLFQYRGKVVVLFILAYY